MTELELNFSAGGAAKSAGIAKVLQHNANWQESAEAIALGLLGEFTSDDIRLACQKAGLPQPKHPNAWGAVISALAKSGAIVRVGFRNSALKSAHARMVGVWRRVE